MVTNVMSVGRIRVKRKGANSTKGLARFHLWTNICDFKQNRIFRTFSKSFIRLSTADYDNPLKDV